MVIFRTADGGELTKSNTPMEGTISERKTKRNQK